MTVFKGISNVTQCEMIVIGDSAPGAVDFSLKGIHYLKVGRTVSKKDTAQIKKFIESRNVTTVHCIHDYAVCYLRDVCRIYKIPLVTTKCGGPRPGFHYYPRISPEIVFSPADKSYFENRALFFRRPVPRLIPNRVLEEPGKFDSRGLAELPVSSEDHSLKILRVARICEAYKESFMQTLALAKALRLLGIAVSVYLVGILQDRNVYGRIEKQLTENDHLLTDDTYTRTGARHIGKVDVVVGTGRSVMEACAQRKIVLCTVSDCTYPVLLTKDNFQYFYAENFSPRVKKLPEWNGEKPVECLAELINNTNAMAHYPEQMRNIYDQYFNFASVTGEYLDIYTGAESDFGSLLMRIDSILHKNITRIKLLGRQILHQH